MRNWQKEGFDFNLVLIALLAVFAFAPLTYPGLFQSHSGVLNVYNLMDLHEMTKPGELIRQKLGQSLGWAPTVGQEYNLFEGDGPLPYALAEPFRLLGMSAPDAIKTVYALSFVLSGLAMYAWAKKSLGDKGGLIAALAYIYLPYHLAVVYVRGALAEALAFIFFPLAFLAFHDITKGGKRFSLALGLLLYVGLILTQAGLALLFALLLMAYVLALKRSGQRIRLPLLTLVAGIAVGFLLLAPSIIKHGLNITKQGNFYDHFLYPFQLFSAAWGYGASRPGWKDTLPMQIGLVPTGLAFLSIVLIARSGEMDEGRKRLLIFFQIATAVMVVAMLYPAAPFWRLSRLSTLLRYPWQLSALVGLALSFLAGSVVALDKRLARFPIWAALITMTILASYSYLSPRFMDFRVERPPFAIFGYKAALLDYELQGPLRHGATIDLTLYWQALQSMDADYTVFVHVIDEEENIWGQADTMPLGGTYPTTSWNLGEIVRDECRVMINVEGPRTGYRIAVGMYLAETGERLPIPGDGTRVILEEK